MDLMNKLFEMKSEMNDSGVFCCFCGPISQDLVVELGNALEQKMDKEETSRTTSNKIFSVVVEQAQNIIHYSAEKDLKKSKAFGDEGQPVGIIAIGRDEGHYFVLCGNKIDTKRAEMLREKLVALQKMDKDELKELYKKERRKEREDKGSKGAGLGFIEMARKASRPIEFKFNYMDSNTQFFSVKTVI